ncbi:E3 ubiquitin-protein ligase WAVH1-like [Senna tora]|uniref:E3 ubiquitin-protein ligase WAVH1-like n=1 Tax=Senna tora TaxID=362788 RepID=A0A834T4N8_9FABA|nr:E3 ubiquitin-protein ligase WAVH1-like [Senna tora]
MVTGWRKVFCTSIAKDTEKCHNNTNTNQTHKTSSNLAFLSNPSTPTLRCRTSLTVPTTTTTTPSSSIPNTPKSPSTFSFLKATLRLSKSRCGICMQSVKAGKGTAIFTSECSHAFHFHCIASHVKNQQILVCPVCNANWKELPLLSIHNDKSSEQNRAHKLVHDFRTLKVYSDDEPLMSPTSVARFNPIFESEEENQEPIEFQGFNVNTLRNNIEMCLLPEAAILAANRSHETYVVLLKLKAPPASTEACRPPIDLVTVLDVGGTMDGPKLQMMKQSMRIVISSLGSTDRLSIVAFSSGSKRLLPLRRMTSSGQRSARRIVDALAAIDQSRDGACVKNEALKKAAKVLEDRREKNPVATIILLSDIHGESITSASSIQKRSSLSVSSMRLPHLDIPIHSVRFPDGSGALAHAQQDDAFPKCFLRLLSMVAQDLRLQLAVASRSLPVEIAAVYSLSGRPNSIGPGLARLGDLYAEEVRELLVELKVPAASAGSHHVLSVRSSYRDPSTQRLIQSKEEAFLIPRPHAVRSSDPKIEHLRNLHVTTRAVAESRRLAEHQDLSGARHLLASARALLIKSASKSADELLRWLEAELAELQRRRQQVQSQRQRSKAVEEKLELLTPTSAWRAAERLAKVAIMRKSMNRVSDLHGFENARF